MRVGIPVSPGVAVGTAYCIYEVYVDPSASVVGEGQALDELARFERAREATDDDLKALIEKVSTQVGEPEAAVFRVQETILRDPALLNKVRGWIVKERQTAQSALHHVLNEYSSLFARTKDEYLRERLADLRDVIIRISGHLTPVLEAGQEQVATDSPLILVADELLPSNVMQLGDRQFVGIVTQAGGRTSHAAILARSRGIPAVSGIPGMLRLVKNGDTVVVDGRNGHVLVNPDPETESAYRKLQREFVDLKDHLAENRDAPAITSDGQAIELLANINSVHDAEIALRMGASGIGLFRTEYLFLTHPGVPDEEEQFDAYRQIIEASPNQRVTIRTLDLGGDKTIPYLGHSREANPFLGWRSIRLSFEHPQFFLTQIRAVLRAAAGAGQRVKLMFPMITTREEMRKVKAMVMRARRQLQRLGQPQGDVSIGLMLEVPAASVCIDQLLELVDFVSIGSNDLVQYLMAADRDNPKVNHLCQPLSPPVIRVLRDVIQTCNEAGKPVTLCGEMAGSPRGFLLLVGLGLRSFSMSPAFIPTIKDLTSHFSRAEAEEIAARVLRYKTSGDIIRYLGQQVARLAPNLGLLDSA